MPTPPPPPCKPPSVQQAFTTGNLSLPSSSSSQFAASSRVYSLAIVRHEHDNGDGGPCIESYWFKIAVNANVVNAASNAAYAIREYLFSQNGSPLSLSIPVHTWTTQQNTDRQTWASFSPVGSARLIPVTGNSSSGTSSSTSPNSSLTGGGSLSFGGTGALNIEFNATDPGSDPNGTETTYPGTLYFSITPSISATMGGPLKAAIFQQSAISNWTWGGDFRAGYQFRSAQPVSLGISGTFSAKGLKSSTKGFSFSLSKMLGGAKKP